MKESVLGKIREELIEEQEFQKAYNEEARRKNVRFNEEIREIKTLGGTPHKMYIDRRTKSDILLRLLKRHEKEIEKDTNRIYVYLGTYREKDDFYESGPEDIQVPYDDKNASYSLYKDLEVDREVLISMDERNWFESRFDIVAGDYRMLQKEFIITALRKGQEKAAKQIVKRYRRSFNYDN